MLERDARVVSCHVFGLRAVWPRPPVRGRDPRGVLRAVRSCHVTRVLFRYSAISVQPSFAITSRCTLDNAAQELYYGTLLSVGSTVVCTVCTRTYVSTVSDVTQTRRD
jgi:hypothetical protein